MMKLKVCGMKFKHNIKALIKVGPDYMGFIFYHLSPRCVYEKFDEAFLSGIPGGINKVGVFVNATTDDMMGKAEQYKLNYLQLHGNESPGQCLKLRQSGYHLIKAFHMDENFDFEILDDYKEVCTFFLFDTKTKNYGGSGRAFDWNILKKYDNEKPFFLSGGITIENIDDLKRIDDLNIHAVDINSRFESSPGVKDMKLVEILRKKLFSKKY